MQIYDNQWRLSSFFVIILLFYSYTINIIREF